MTILVDGYVGPLRVPLVSDGYPSAVLDPTVVGLADYFAFWTRYGLSTKLSEQNEDIQDPLPADNVFPYEANDNWVRDSIPALYLWWSGASELVKITPYISARRRTLRLFYVAREAVMPNGGTVNSGLPAAIDAVMHKASDAGYHPDYGYNGAPRGTPIGISLRLRGWEYTRGQPDFVQVIPNVSSVPGGTGGGHVMRGYPVLLGLVTVVEEIDAPTPTAPNLRDLPFGANVNDPTDPSGPLRILDRYLISPSQADEEHDEQA